MCRYMRPTYADEALMRAARGATRSTMYLKRNACVCAGVESSEAERDECQQEHCGAGEHCGASEHCRAGEHCGASEYDAGVCS